MLIFPVAEPFGTSPVEADPDESLSGLTAADRIYGLDGDERMAALEGGDPVGDAGALPGIAISGIAVAGLAPGPAEGWLTE